MKIKFAALTTIICLAVAFSGNTQQVRPNTYHSTWDTALCYKDNPDGTTTMYARCITPMDNGPCSTYTACPTGSAPNNN